MHYHQNIVHYIPTAFTALAKRDDRHFVLVSNLAFFFSGDCVNFTGLSCWTVDRAGKYPKLEQISRTFLSSTVSVEKNKYNLNNR